MSIEMARLHIYIMPGHQLSAPIANLYSIRIYSGLQSHISVLCDTREDDSSSAPGCQVVIGESDILFQNHVHASS